MKKILFNDNWLYNGQKIALPHDAMLALGRAKDNPSGSAQGFFKTGKYTYEKVFEVAKDLLNKDFILSFDGVYKNPVVYLNDKVVYEGKYGYVPFLVNLAGVKEGTNKITVKCSNADQPDSRWYTGAGIYRSVNLYICEKGGYTPNSVKVKTISYNPAVIEISSLVDGEYKIYDGNKVVATAKGKVAKVTIEDAKLYSTENPFMYKLVATNKDDSYETNFGVRLVEVNPNGLFVNGVNTLLRGGCIHHDNGVVGAVSLKGAEYRKIKKLKEVGFNAVRIAHNPASTNLLEVCDELGMYVMDEMWDMWYNHKSKYDYATDWEANYESDIKNTIDRDYNHPSVILYSIGNEVSEPATEKGQEYAKKLVETFKKYDDTRIITGGFNLMIITSASKGKGIYDNENGGQKNDNSDKMSSMSSTMFNLVASMVGTGMNSAANGKKSDEVCSKSLQYLDACGYNYASGRYKLDVKLHPNRVIFGSETFPQDIYKNWQMVKQYPTLIGDFMWTAWDYLGETGIGAWSYEKDGKAFNKPYPWFAADTGAFDFIGTPNGEVALATATWGLDEKPWIGVMPVNHNNMVPSKSTWRGSNAMASWSFKGCDGNKAEIEVYSSAYQVQVFLNGKSLGFKKLKGCAAKYKTKYASGKLEVIAYDNKKQEVSRNFLISANDELGIKADVTKYNDLYFVELSIKDDNGIVECNADTKLNLSVKNGEILGFGSANPRTEESFLTNSYLTYYGRTLAVVRGSNKTVIEVTSDNFDKATIKFD